MRYRMQFHEYRIFYQSVKPSSFGDAGYSSYYERPLSVITLQLCNRRKVVIYKYSVLFDY